MTMQTARSVMSSGHERIAPDGWVFVTNDPDVEKAPDRIVSLFNRTFRVVLIIDTKIETFIIRNLASGTDTPASRTLEDPETAWRVGRTKFKDLGDIGRAVDAVLTTP